MCVTTKSHAAYCAPRLTSEEWRQLVVNKVSKERGYSQVHLYLPVAFILICGFSTAVVSGS